MEEAADLKERLLRTMADMENLRKRTEREKAEATLYAATSFARDLLSVADSLDRALQSIPEEGRDTLDEATRNLLAGIEVTHKELLNVFSRHGIARIEPMGGKFDPHFHQAMFEVPDASSPPGTVVQVMQAGYTIGERCLRPALVGVAKAPPAESGTRPRIDLLGLDPSPRGDCHEPGHGSSRKARGRQDDYWVPRSPFGSPEDDAGHVIASTA
jgi:molecular chaperone GrpE